MDTFEEFKRHLRDALTHLYDPAYRPPELLWAVTGCDPQQGVEAVQAVIIQAIEDLKPAPDVPPTARSRRICELLSYRCVLLLTHKEGVPLIMDLSIGTANPFHVLLNTFLTAASCGPGAAR
jgi:hypothetical protein